MEYGKLRDTLREKKAFIKRLKIAGWFKAFIILVLALNQLRITNTINEKMDIIIALDDTKECPPEGIKTTYSISKDNKWVGIEFTDSIAVVYYQNKETGKVIIDTLR